MIVLGRLNLANDRRLRRVIGVGSKQAQLTKYKGYPLRKNKLKKGGIFLMSHGAQRQHNVVYKDVE